MHPDLCICLCQYGLHKNCFYLYSSSVVDVDNSALKYVNILLLKSLFYTFIVVFSISAYHRSMHLNFDLLRQGFVMCLFRFSVVMWLFPSAIRKWHCSRFVIHIFSLTLHKMPLFRQLFVLITKPFLICMYFRNFQRVKRKWYGILSIKLTEKFTRVSMLN